MCLEAAPLAFPALGVMQHSPILVIIVLVIISPCPAAAVPLCQLTSGLT